LLIKSTSLFKSIYYDYHPHKMEENRFNPPFDYSHLEKGSREFSYLTGEIAALRSQ